MREFWRHAAAYLAMTFLGNRFYLKIDPTWVFTTDGEHVMRGPEVGRLAIQWSGAERKSITSLTVSSDSPRCCFSCTSGKSSGPARSLSAGDLL